MSSKSTIDPQEEIVTGSGSGIPAASPYTPIAIVGIGFRGPAEAKNVGKLWEMILAGREAWSPIPAKRWNSAAFHHPDHTRHGTVSGLSREWR